MFAMWPENSRSSLGYFLFLFVCLLVCDVKEGVINRAKESCNLLWSKSWKKKESLAEEVISGVL